MHRHLDRVIDTILSATEFDAVARARSEAADRRKEVLRRSAISKPRPKSDKRTRARA
jgi:GntR family transcriptional repressor for pyruvate dehydrogenase complex